MRCTSGTVATRTSNYSRASTQPRSQLSYSPNFLYSKASACTEQNCFSSSFSRGVPGASGCETVSARISSLLVQFNQAVVMNIATEAHMFSTVKNAESSCALASLSPAT